MKIPFKCPICNGVGLVAGGFYNSVSGTSISDVTTEQCRQCNGTGIIWSEDEFDLSIHPIQYPFGQTVNLPIEEYYCDSCKCHPSILYQTPTGRFCKNCNPQIL